MNRPPSKTKNKNQNNEIENYNDDNNKKEYHHPFYPVLTTNYRKKLSKQCPSLLIFFNCSHISLESF